MNVVFMKNLSRKTTFQEYDYIILSLLKFHTEKNGICPKMFRIKKKFLYDAVEIFFHIFHCIKNESF